MTEKSKPLTCDNCEGKANHIGDWLFFCDSCYQEWLEREVEENE